MADILVYGALKELEEVLNVNQGIGLDVQRIKTAIDTAISNVDSSFTFTPLYTLEKLSCVNEISHCLCNFAGSGTNNVGINSSWNTTSPYGVGGLSTIYYKIMSLPEMDDIKTEIEDFESSTLKNNIKKFIELYTTKKIEALDESSQIYWFNTSKNKLKVCSDDFAYGAGAQCTWTVPEGTTKVKFQLWGAGVGTATGCCCGGAPFGANGAYSELSMCVTPGDQYVLCAGCSCCNNDPAGNKPTCMSGVTGPGICCLKADGGSHCTRCVYNCATGALNGITCFRFQNPYCTTSGPCWCLCGTYCFATSCATCGVVPVYPDCFDRTFCSVGCTDRTISAGGHRPLHGGGCLDTNGYGYHTRPPILDSDTCSKFCGGCECVSFTTGSCGACTGDSWKRHPGMGGAHSHISGTHECNKPTRGGRGTGGMVQVIWE